MTPTIGLVANVYQEANALPGWLETHLPFFDDVRLYHAGPNGAFSDDGTIEIARKWGIPIAFGSIDRGFGVVRTEAVRFSPCDYVMILDADERFYPVHHRLICSGEPTTQDEVNIILRSYDFRDVHKITPDMLSSVWDNVARLGANLHVDIGDPYYQGARLREILTTEQPETICTIRRHWHDFSWRRPTQNWHMDPDWQLRIVRNDPSVYFDPDQRVHEHLVWPTTKGMFRADMERGPFFDHFHFTFKRMEIEQRAHDVAIYDAIHKGERPPSWREFRS